MIAYCDAPQGSDAWLRDRLGCATASRFADILATTKTGPAASRKNYLTQLVLERLTGKVADSFTSEAMERGTELEPAARAAFEVHTGLIVQQVGFGKSGDWLGVSVDGLIGDDEGVEFKAPNSATHLEWMLGGTIPAKHVPQVQGALWLTGRKRWHFASFDDRFPPHLQLFHVVVERDQKFINGLALAVEIFLNEVADTVEKLSQLKEAA